jgi:hypothetical protein
LTFNTIFIRHKKAPKQKNSATIGKHADRFINDYSPSLSNRGVPHYHLSAILRGFIIELATLPSAFRGSVFSHTLARHHHFSYGGLFGLSAYLFSALRQFMLA